MIGTRYDLTDDEAIYQGADWWKDFQLVNPDTGLPYNLTGCTVRAQARKDSGDSQAAISFDCSILDEQEGKLRLALTNTATSAIPRGNYHYDAELSVGDAIHKIIIPSLVQVVEEYTKG